MSTPTKSSEKWPNVQLYLLDIQTTSCKQRKVAKNERIFLISRSSFLSQRATIANDRPRPRLNTKAPTFLLSLFFCTLRQSEERALYKWIFKRHAVVSSPKTETVDCWLLYFTWKTFKLLLLISQLRPAKMKWGQTRHTAMSQKITHSSSSLHA